MAALTHAMFTFSGVGTKTYTTSRSATADITLIDHLRAHAHAKERARAGLSSLVLHEVLSSHLCFGDLVAGSADPGEGPRRDGGGGVTRRKRGGSTGSAEGREPPSFAAKSATFRDSGSANPWWATPIMQAARE